MTALIEQAANDALADDHNRLAPALDVAVKVHMLLEGVSLASWTVLPGQVLGQLSKPDEATVIGQVAWLSRQPGWSLVQSPMKTSPFIAPWIELSAVTEMDGVTVRLWTTITADILSVSATTGAAA
ncbi:hypothetical protein Caci_3053 [Catenulispora acidiphila DSM 44928]|uniref:Uncharacterized protein n=1 Tax=Catenulispora acidiphila (strain DSM 44928 / JCM 14897 / NBRC 102108 / NRRL B-24433 / ID139908) TaxID=479433 RepID=C7Q4J3_CATAD|nr:hypothetical protein [Catenulispora acidiphila]ACU71962.1 hypothetical protein Caci_3053 [Catenulispora acidiphila DSM 44928]